MIPFCSNTGSKRDDAAYWNSEKNSLGLIEISGMIKLVWLRFLPVVILDDKGTVFNDFN